MNALKVLFVALAVVAALEEVLGHGMMLDPPNRSSLWRTDPTAPINYNDNELFCGGYTNQWVLNKGKCGVCGNNYADPVPRGNENTGEYGQGKIVAEYKSGSVITVYVRLTTNHKGWFNYSICDLKDSSKPEKEECFQTVLFTDGTVNYEIDAKQTDFYNTIRLPMGLRCKHCVLRWVYKAANFWGICEDGTGALGCGDQENYRSCADISIL